MLISKEDKLNLDYILTKTGESVDEWIKRRNSLLDNLTGYRPDFRKSQDAKRNWRLHGRDYKKAIKKWHKSTAGKKFHRQLNRFNAMHSGEAAEALTEIISLTASESKRVIPDLDFNLQYLECLDLIKFTAECARNKIEKGMKVNEARKDNDFLFINWMEGLYEHMENSGLSPARFDKRNAGVKI